MADTIKLPYNPQGNLPAARISEEPATVRPSTGEGYNFIVPVYAPYFREGLKIYNPATDTYLVEGVDYLCTHSFKSMASLVGLEIYGSFMLIDTAFSGTLQISYNSLGGDFTLDQQQVLEMLANAITDPRITYWENVADTPIVYPPINHQHNVETDTMTWDDVVTAIYSLGDSLATGMGIAMDAINEHALRKDNPHAVTKVQVGLGNVLNYTVATEDDLTTKGENLYMTLEMTRIMIASLGGDNAAAHIVNYNNPHQVTKEQVGLGLVDNNATATPDDVVKGTAKNLFVTPEGVMAAIQANAVDGLSDHLADYHNPHKVTSDQVGLGNVSNYAVADDEDAVAGTADNKYLTVATGKKLLDTFAAPLHHTHDPEDVGCLPLDGGVMTGGFTFTRMVSGDGGTVIDAADNSIKAAIGNIAKLVTDTITSASKVTVTAGGLNVKAGGIQVGNGDLVMTNGNLYLRSMDGNESYITPDGDIVSSLWANSYETGATIGHLSNWLKDFGNEILAQANGGWGDIDTIIQQQVFRILQVNTDGTMVVNGDETSFTYGVMQPWTGSFIADDFQAESVDPIDGEEPDDGE